MEMSRNHRRAKEFLVTVALLLLLIGLILFHWPLPWSMSGLRNIETVEQSTSVPRDAYGVVAIDAHGQLLRKVYTGLVQAPKGARLVAVANAMPPGKLPNGDADLFGKRMKVNVANNGEDHLTFRVFTHFPEDFLLQAIQRHLDQGEGRVVNSYFGMAAVNLPEHQIPDHEVAQLLDQAVASIPESEFKLLNYYAERQVSIQARLKEAMQRLFQSYYPQLPVQVDYIHMAIGDPYGRGGGAE